MEVVSTEREGEEIRRLNTGEAWRRDTKELKLRHLRTGHCSVGCSAFSVPSAGAYGTVTLCPGRRILLCWCYWFLEGEWLRCKGLLQKWEKLQIGLSCCSEKEVLLKVWRCIPRIPAGAANRQGTQLEGKGARKSLLPSPALQSPSSTPYWWADLGRTGKWRREIGTSLFSGADVLVMSFIPLFQKWLSTLTSNPRSTNTS